MFEKLGLTPLKKLHQLCRIEVVTGLEVHFGSGGGKAVPGAGYQAIVTAIDSVSHQWTQSLWNCTAVFDCEVG